MKSHLSHKELTEHDLIKEHRQLLVTHIKTNTEHKFRTRKKILKLYDAAINKDNIRYYLNRNIKIFMACLVTGQLKKAANYFPKDYLNN